MKKVLRFVLDLMLVVLACWSWYFLMGIFANLVYMDDEIRDDVTIEFSGKAGPKAPHYDVETLAEHKIEIYCEGDGKAPHWYRPHEPMAVEWAASYQQVKEVNDEAISEKSEEEIETVQQVNYLLNVPLDE